MDEQERLRFDPYHNPYPLASGNLRKLVEKVNDDSGLVPERFNECGFGDMNEMIFLYISLSPERVCAKTLQWLYDPGARDRLNGKCMTFSDFLE
jgi:hypothetical protein